METRIPRLNLLDMALTPAALFVSGALYVAYQIGVEPPLWPFFLVATLLSYAAARRQWGTMLRVALGRDGSASDRGAEEGSPRLTGRGDTPR